MQMEATLDLTGIDIDHLDQITDFPTLTAWTKDCTSCGLRQESSQVTHYDGDPQSPIMIVGMNPGFCEDGTGIPFTGRAELARSRCVSCTHYTDCFNWQTGQGAARPRVERCRGYAPLPPGTPTHVPPLSISAGRFTIGGLRSAGQIFDEALLALGIDRSKLFITNSALCKSAVGEPKPQYVNRCSSIRLRTQQLVQPKIVIALGRLAIGQYSGKAITLKNLHGVAFKYKDARSEFLVVPTYHPSAILRKMLTTGAQSSPEELKRVAEDIATEKWALYQDLGNAFNMLDQAQLANLILPGTSLKDGKLVLRTRT